MAIIENSPISHSLADREKKIKRKKKKKSQRVRNLENQNASVYNMYKIIFPKVDSYKMVLVFWKRIVLPLEKQGWKIAG